MKAFTNLNLKVTWFIFFVFMLTGLSTVFAQTKENIIPKLYLPSKGVPSGNENWNIENQIIGNASTDYWKLFEGSVLTTPSLDLSRYTNVEIVLRIQSFGTITNNSNVLYVEQSESGQSFTVLKTYATGAAVNETLPIVSTDGAVKFKFYAPASTNAAGARLLFVEILGAPITTPSLTLSETTLDFGDIISNNSSSLDFTLTAKNITKNLSLSVEGEGFTVSPTSLTPEQLANPQIISVNFAPTEQKLYNASLKIGGIGSDFEAHDSVIHLRGTGVSASSPMMSADISEHNYGKVYVGEDSVLDLRVNAENLSENIRFSGLEGSAFRVSTGAEWSSTEGGLLHITYAPTAIGEHTATLILTANDKTAEIVLNGTGIEPSLNFNAQALNFEAVRLSKTKEMMLIVKGENLKEDALATVSGEGFSVNKVSLDKEKMSTQKGDTLSVSFAPKMIQAYNGSVKITNSGKEYTINLSGSGLAMPDFIEDFEEFPNNLSYGGTTLTVDGREWTIRGFSAMTSGSDRYMGSRSIRLRGNSATDINFIQMDFDKPNGIHVLSFMMGSYGTHSGGKVHIEYSKDAGATWLASGDTLTIDSWAKEGEQMKKKEVVLNISGDVRLRISKIYTSGSTSVNIDEIMMSNYASNPVLTADITKVEHTYNLGEAGEEKTIGLEGSDLTAPLTVEILKDKTKANAVFKTSAASFTVAEANKKFNIQVSLDLPKITEAGTYIDTLYVHSTEVSLKLSLQLTATANPVLVLNSSITEKRLSVSEGKTDSTTLVFKAAKNLTQDLQFSFANPDGKTIFTIDPASIVAATAMAGEFSIKIKTLAELTEGQYTDKLSVKTAQQEIFTLPFFLTVTASTAPAISILAPQENAELTTEDFTAEFQLSNIDLSQATNKMEVFTEPATQSFSPNELIDNKVSVNFTGVASGDYILKAKLKIDGAEVAEAQTNFNVNLSTIAAPVFTPAAGSYNSYQEVGITCATQGAEIRYTTDGSTPTIESLLYSEPIEVQGNMKIKTRISCKNYNPRFDSAAYIITMPIVGDVSFSPVAGTYEQAVSVVLSSTTEGAAIYYTMDETTPSKLSTLYTQPIQVDKSVTIQAIAYKDQMNASSIVSAQYVIKLSEEEIIPEGKVVFKEDFNGFTDGAPNSGASSKEISTMDDYTEMPGWTGTKVYSAGGAVKLGTGSLLGSITTPALDLSHNEGVFYVSFKAMAWKGDAQNLYIISGEDTLSVDNLPNKEDYTFKNYVLKFENGDASTKIIFTAEKEKNNRFFIDSVYVYQVVPAASEPTITAPAIVEMETVQSIEVSKQIVVKGELLKADVSITSDKALFLARPSSLSKEQVMSAEGATFEVVYMGNQLVDSASIRLTSSGVEKLIKVYLFAESITEVADLQSLRAGNIGSYYKVKGEVVLSAKNPSNRNQKWVQDAKAGILIDDAKSVVTTQYNIGDGISSMIGSLAKFGEQLQFVPLQDFGTASSQGNTLTPIVLRVDQLKEAVLEGTYESRLVKIQGVKFIAAGNFESNKDYMAVQGEDTLNVRTFIRDADYIATEIPTELVDMLCIAARYNQDLQVAPRFLSDITIAGEEPEECEQPSNLQVSDIDTNSANLSWEGEAMAYEVQIGEQESLIVYTKSHKAAGLKANTVYTWKLRSLCENDIFSPWVEASFKTKERTNIEDVQAINIRIYPNPSNGIFTVEVPQTMQMDIYNISGSRIMSREVQSKESLNLKTYGKGLYFIRFTSQDAWQSVQRIIIR